MMMLITDHIITLTLRVKVILATVPRKLGSEGGKKIVDGPGNDHVVIEANKGNREKVGKSQPLEHGGHIGVEGDWAHG